MKEQWKEQFVKELSQKVRHFSCGQYEEHSVEMIAFQDGVSTAIGMMAIDLLGGVKTKGMLGKLLEEQQEEFLNQPANAHDQEVRKNIIHQILQDAPEDIVHTGMIEDMRLRNGYNYCNAIWKEKLSKLIK